MYAGTIRVLNRRDGWGQIHSRDFGARVRFTYANVRDRHGMRCAMDLLEEGDAVLFEVASGVGGAVRATDVRLADPRVLIRRRRLAVNSNTNRNVNSNSN